MANNSSVGNIQDRLPFSKGDSNSVNVLIYSVLSRIRNFLPEIRHANSLLAGQSPEQIRCDSDTAFTEGDEHIELDLLLFKKARKRTQDIASGPPARRPLIECLTASECDDRDVDVHNAGDSGHTDRPNVVTASNGATDSAASASSSASARELLDVHEAASLPRLVRDLLPPSDASADEDEDEEEEEESESEGGAPHSGASSDDEDDDPLAGRAIRLGVQLSEGTSAASGEIVALRIPDANSPSSTPCASHSLLVRSQSSASESDE